MDQRKAPLYEALRDRRLKGESSFHVPGHKFGRGLLNEEKAEFFSVMGIDYTEIEGLDDLHHPEGVIAEAQQLAAACFGAEHSYFLVGGSTVGNLAMLTAVCGQRELMLVQRNVHKSVMHGLMLAGARAVFLEPEKDSKTGIAGCVSLETVQSALAQYPGAKGVFLTNPNYYGMGRNLEQFAQAVHSYGIPLLVDEAHGAHFGFHKNVPSSALSCGADAVVQSTHKMLTAMTMGAMLHVQGPRLNRRRLEERLSMLQSSSPSYPLMASLDLARRTAAVRGEEMLGWVLRGLQQLRHAYGQPDEATRRAYDYTDPFKLVLYDPAEKRTGFRIMEELASLHMVTEMADDRYAVLACSLATGDEDLSRLERALQKLDLRLLPHSAIGNSAAPLLAAAGEKGAAAERAHPRGEGLDRMISMPVQMALPEDELTELVPLEHAAGRQAAQSLIPYPPGIPIIIPGEVIRASVVEKIGDLARAGARFQGAEHVGPGCSILVKKS